MYNCTPVTFCYSEDCNNAYKLTLITHSTEIQQITQIFISFGVDGRRRRNKTAQDNNNYLQYFLPNETVFK